MAARLTGSTLKLTVDTKEYDAEISEYELLDTEEDAGTITFKQASGETPAAQQLKVVTVQSVDAASLHQTVYDNPGKTGVAFTFAPAGNAVPSAIAPHWTGTLTFPTLRPSISMTAGDKDSTTEIVFSLNADTKKVTKP